MNGIATLPYEVHKEPMIPSEGIGKIKNATNLLAQFGREGDTYMVHASEGETVLPLEVLNSNPKMKQMIYKQMEELGLDPKSYIVGNKLNSINPVTGAPEFFFKKIFRAVKRIVKKAAPIVLPIAAPFIFPAMPVALAAGLGSFAGNMIAGKGIKNSLKSAAISAALAGIGNIAFGQAQMNPFEKGFGEGFGSGTFWGSRLNPAGTFGDAMKVGIGDMFSPVNPFTSTTPTHAWVDSSKSGSVAPMTNQTAGDASNSFLVDAGEGAKTIDVSGVGERIAPPADKTWFQKYIYDSAQNVPMVQTNAAGQPFVDTTGEGYLESIFSPNRASIQPMNIKLEAGVDAANQAKQLAAAFGAPAPSGQDLLNVAMDTSAKTVATAPGILKQYTPALLGTGTAVAGGMALAGDFQPVDEDGDGVPEYWTNGYDYYTQDPTKYGFGQEFYGQNPYYQGTGYIPPAVQTVAGGGEIMGPGTPTSDSIPAMLSDGEFVMNAKAVRGAGGGDRKKGAQRMYAMMRQFERRT